MLAKIFNHKRKENDRPLDWDNPGRAVRIGWTQTNKLNETLAQMMSIASYSEGIAAEHVAQVQIHLLTRSTNGLGNVRFTRLLEGATILSKTILKDTIQFVSPRDVSRLASDIMKRTDEQTKLTFRTSHTPTKQIIQHITEDALALITAGSIAGQMGIDADENTIVRK